MKRSLKLMPYLAVLCLGMAGSAGAEEKGIAYDNNTGVVKDNYGECVRTQWQDSTLPPACGGMQQSKPAPVVQIPETAYVPPPEPTRSVRKVHSNTKLGGKTLFATNKYALTPQGRRNLESTVQEMHSQRNVTNIVVRGYTDSRGSDALNQRLSNNRANTVKAYLRSRLHTNDIRAQGMGSRDPVASNSKPSGRELNRRVEISWDHTIGDN